MPSTRSTIHTPASRSKLAKGFRQSHTFPSGNGAAGGNFTFRAVVLPSDANRDNQVNLTDQGIVSSNFGLAGGWSIGNFDGDATVDLDDAGRVSNNFGYIWNSWISTPAGPGAPMAPRPQFVQKLPPSLVPDRWRELAAEDDLELLAAAQWSDDEAAATQTAGWWAAYALEEDEEEAALAAG